MSKIIYFPRYLFTNFRGSSNQFVMVKTFGNFYYKFLVKSFQKETHKTIANLSSLNLYGIVL